MKPRLLTLMTLGLLVLGAMATPVLADDDDEQRGRDDSPRGHGSREEQARCAGDATANATSNSTADDCRSDDSPRGPGGREEQRAVAEEWRARCPDGRDTLNATTNETEERCHDASAFAHEAKKARREAHALVHAVEALEHRIAKLEMKEYEIRGQLEDGNLTANETAELEHKLERIQEAQDQMMDRLTDLQERMATLGARWDAADDHIRERRGHSDDGPEDEPEEEES